MIWSVFEHLDNILVKGVMIEISIVAFPLLDGAEHKTSLQCAETGEMMLR
jgi:hypothetical protein